MRCLLLALFVCAWTLGACNSPSEAAQRAWRVGSDLDNPPFAWIDEAGRPRGRDVEMAAELARELRVTLDWRRMEFGRLLDALEAGEVDAVIATLGATPERAQRVLLSTPYYVTSLRVLVRRGAGEPRSLADLSGRRVSAGIGTTSEQALRERLPEASAAEPSAKGETSLERLLNGEVDALVMDGPDAIDFAREHPDRLALIETPLADERYVVAIRPGATDALTRIDAALRRLRERGTLAELDRRFGLEPDGASSD